MENTHSARIHANENIHIIQVRTVASRGKGSGKGKWGQAKERGWREKGKDWMILKVKRWSAWTEYCLAMQGTWAQMLTAIYYQFDLEHGTFRWENWDHSCHFKVHYFIRYILNKVVFLFWSFLKRHSYVPMSQGYYCPPWHLRVGLSSSFFHSILKWEYTPTRRISIHELCRKIQDL